MKLLTLGKIKQKDLEDFFGLSQKYLTNNKKQKEKYLDILHEYCEYEIVTGPSGRCCGYEITEIYNEGPYETNEALRNKVIAFVEEEWGKYDDQGGTADSLTIVTNRYCNENGIEWKLPRYIPDQELWSNESRSRHEYRPIRKRNPEMRSWWRIYGIITKHFHKDNKKSHRIYLEVSKDHLSCFRLTEEKTKIVQELSGKYFGQKYVSIYELREAAELFKGQEQISIKDLEKQIPAIGYVANSERWNAFIRACERAGVSDVIKGCDRKEIEQMFVFSREDKNNMLSEEEEVK